jgi:nitrate reductase NapE component
MNDEIELIKTRPEVVMVCLSCCWLQSDARDIFLAKQANERKEKWVLGNFTFFRMHRITDIYFVGGFGTVQWIDVKEYLSSAPDAIATNSPGRTLQVRGMTQL